MTPDVGKAVSDFKGGKVEYRTDRYGNVHVHDRQGELRRGRAQPPTCRSVLEELERAKPASSKGRYFRRITISSTMGPGIKVDPNRMFEFEDEAA